MKKSLLLVVALVLASFSFAIAVDNGPAEINLKDAWQSDTSSQKSAMFNHELHQAANTCTDCHATEAGGKFRPEGAIKGMGDANVAHKFCWACHAKQDTDPVKKTCNKCHTGPKK